MAKLFRVDKHVDNRVQPTKKVPVKLTAATKSGTVLTLTFDQPVRLGGTPRYATDVAGAEPVSATLIEPEKLELVFSEDIDTATQVSIPFEDPAVRNAVGGFVADSTFPVAA